MNEKNDRADAVFVFGRFPPYSEGANFHPFFVSDVKFPEGAGFDKDTDDRRDHSFAMYILKARTKNVTFSK